jgi:hypothetical protein
MTFSKGQSTIRLAIRTDIPALHTLVGSAYRGETARQGRAHDADFLGGQRTCLTSRTSVPGASTHH